MPRMCNCYGCSGNYPGQPYTKTVSFPNDPDERERWIQAMPNDPASLRSLKQINICASHFNCTWKSSRGGSRPSEPPSVFSKNIPKSCLKQIPTKRRSTSLSTSEARTEKTRLNAEQLDRIADFDSFCAQFSMKFPEFKGMCRNDDFFVSKTDEIGRKVVTFLHFKKVTSSFGFLFLDSVERSGVFVSKKIFPLHKNGLVSKWSQIEEIVLLADKYEPDNSDILKTVLELMEMLVDCHELPNYQFIIAQLKLLLIKRNGRRFDSTTLVFAIQIHNISPSAYKMIRRSGSIVLPSLKLIRNFLSKSIQDENLKDLFSRLKREP